LIDYKNGYTLVPTPQGLGTLLFDNITSCYALKSCDDVQMILSIGTHMVETSTKSYSCDYIYLRPINFLPNSMTLTFESKINVLDAAMQPLSNNLLVLVVVNGDVYILTISLMPEKSYVKYVHDSECGFKQKFLHHLHGSWDIGFDDTGDQFFITKPSINSEQDDSDDDCPPRKKRVVRPWGQGTVGEDGAELYEEV
jgi:hypothetical protein